MCVSSGVVVVGCYFLFIEDISLMVHFLCTNPPPFFFLFITPSDLCLSFWSVFNQLIKSALVFCLHVYLYEGVRSPRTAVKDSCEMPWGCSLITPQISLDAVFFQELKPTTDTFLWSLCYIWILAVSVTAPGNFANIISIQLLELHNTSTSHWEPGKLSRPCSAGAAWIESTHCPKSEACSLPKMF